MAVVAHPFATLAVLATMLVGVRWRSQPTVPVDALVVIAFPVAADHLVAVHVTVQVAVAFVSHRVMPVLRPLVQSVVSHLCGMAGRGGALRRTATALGRRVPVLLVLCHLSLESAGRGAGPG
jgi:hypothetical protein